MVDRDVILAKTNQIQNALARIEEMTHNGVEKVISDQDVQDIVVLNLQRAVQSTIDIASYVVSAEKLGIPQTQSELFKVLHQQGCIPEK